MKKRRYKRFPVTLKAKVISNGKCYEGIIGNVSEEGVAHIITTFVQTSEDFTPKREIELNFKIPSGETLNLDCEVRWFLRPSHGENTIVLGMKIVAPSAEYREWLKKIEGYQG